MPPEAEPWAVGILAGVNLLPLCETLFHLVMRAGYCCPQSQVIVALSLEEFSLGIALPASNSSLSAPNKVKKSF